MGAAWRQHPSLPLRRQQEGCETIVVGRQEGLQVRQHIAHRTLTEAGIAPMRPNIERLSHRIEGEDLLGRGPARKEPL
jgi:hypothetical protein